jgi:hypothetical protein
MPIAPSNNSVYKRDISTDTEIENSTQKYG